MWTSLPARSFIARSIIFGCAGARISWLMMTLPSSRRVRRISASQAPSAWPDAPPQSCSVRSSAARNCESSGRASRDVDGKWTPWSASVLVFRPSRVWM